MALKIGLVLWILTFKAAEERQISGKQAAYTYTQAHGIMLRQY